MEPALYENLVNALSPTEGSNYDEDLINCIEHNRKANEVSLTIKNYPVGGLSQTIHNKLNAQFRVSGPMGKNLNIDTASLNVAFCAGTGILPFMDLVGFMARQTLNLTKFDTINLQKSFFFWMNVR